MTDPSFTAERMLLGQYLATAARVEQAVMCQYLFAAFSMKRDIAEGGVTYAQLEWMRRTEAQIMRVARQEMEHLGLVQNLRCAIGEAPVLDLPPMPYVETVLDTPVEVTLERFGPDSLLRFALLELPENLPESSPDFEFLAKRVKNFSIDRFDAIARLYDGIRELFQTVPEAVLFVGPPGAQFDTHEIFPGVIRGLSLSNRAAYNFEMSKVTCRKDALAVIDQITIEGEGADDRGGGSSHFAVFLDALIEMVKLTERDPGFAPARDVVANPSLHPDATVPITDKFTRDAMALFEVCHQTMMMMLGRFFAFPDDDDVEMLALQHAVFFPMMTTIIRPLAEVLTLLPVGGSGSPRAGASFLPAGPVELTPHRDAAFRVLKMRYDTMATMAADLVRRAEAMPADALPTGLRDRLTLLQQQIARCGFNLQVDYGRQPGDF